MIQTVHPGESLHGPETPVLEAKILPGTEIALIDLNTRLKAQFIPFPIEYCH